MSKPELKIVVALLEGYISQRYEKNWGLKETEDNKTTLPTSEKDRKKIDSLVRVLHALPSETAKKKGKTVNATEKQMVKRWVHFLTVLKQEELVHAKVGYWTDFLEQTLTAIRSYILDELKDNQILLKIKNDLEAKLNNAELSAEDKQKAQQTMNALVVEPGLLNKYFPKNMIGYDAKTIELKETTVEQFKENAMDEAKRPTPLVSRLLRTFPKPAPAVAPVEASAANDNNTPAKQDVVAAPVAEKAANDNHVTAANAQPQPAMSDVASSTSNQEEDAHLKLAKRLAELKSARLGRPVGAHTRFYKQPVVSEQEVQNMSRELRRIQGK